MRILLFPFLLFLSGCAGRIPKQEGARWWQSGVIYQVYPRSFQDSDGDGVGDLRGITRRLDYLRDLGVNAIWISPIFPSPMRDFGYDVSDYTGIDPLFGGMEDFTRLLTAAHARGLKVLLDFVPNHTSDLHPWFKESRAAKTSSKRDWYVWRDASAGGGPPNNWKSQFGGSAWTRDKPTGQYYYHAFLKEQPDLNWRNPEVARAMLDNMRFWLARGVDGFRVDALLEMMEDPRFRDNPPNPAYVRGGPESSSVLPVYTRNLADNHLIVRKIREVIDEFPDRLLIGETYLPPDELVAYYGSERAPEAHLPFNFALISAPWEAPRIRELIRSYEAALPAGSWPNWVTGNHDNRRVATRWGDAQARGAALLLLTLRGTPTVYYGEEIGMRDVPIPPESVQDPAEKNEPGKGKGRDPERTPMQWSPEAGGGFTTGHPWLPLAADYRGRNVEMELKSPRSMLALYRRLLSLRSTHPALSAGDYVEMPGNAEVLAFERRAGGQRMIIALNFSGKALSYRNPEAQGRLLLSTALDREGENVSGEIRLRPYEGVVVERAGASLSPPR